MSSTGRNGSRIFIYGACAVLVLLIVATIGTRTPTGDLIWQVETAPVETTLGPAPGGNTGDEGEDDGEFTQEIEITDAGVNVMNIFWLAVLALALGVLALLLHKERAIAAPEEDDQSPSHDQGHRGSLREVTSSAVEEALERLDVGAAVDHAIIECWRSLGQAAAAEGVSADRSRTSSELVEAIVDATSAAREDVVELAELYRTARYSGRLATDVDLTRARACLTAIREALR